MQITPNQMYISITTIQALRRAGDFSGAAEEALDLGERLSLSGNEKLRARADFWVNEADSLFDMHIIHGDPQCLIQLPF